MRTPNKLDTRYGDNLRVRAVNDTLNEYRVDKPDQRHYVECHPHPNPDRRLQRGLFPIKAVTIRYFYVFVSVATTHSKYRSFGFTTIE